MITILSFKATKKNKLILFDLLTQRSFPKNIRFIQQEGIDLILAEIDDTYFSDPELKSILLNSTEDEQLETYCGSILSKINLFINMANIEPKIFQCDLKTWNYWNNEFKPKPNNNLKMSKIKCTYCENYGKLPCEECDKANEEQKLSKITKNEIIKNTRKCK